MYRDVPQGVVQSEMCKSVFFFLEYVFLSGHTVARQMPNRRENSALHSGAGVFPL